jgi:hypothetical protein
MKVLVSSTGTAASVLVFSQDGDAKFLALRDGTEHTEGTVAEVPDVEVARHVQMALTDAEKKMAEATAKAEKVSDNAIGIPFGSGGPFAYVERKDLLRDVRFISKNIIDVPEGTTVKVRRSGRTAIALDIPKSALPDRQAGLRIGSKVAVGPNVTPKPLMNARGTVVGIRGVRASIDFDEGDLDRVKRATGKTFTNPVPMHKATLEVIA